MNIFISNSDQRPIYEQIVAQIKGLIIAQKLPPGYALPSIRLLARDLKISVITTKRAYEELERDGFIETVAGKGSFVCGGNTDLLREHKIREIEEKLSEAVLMAQEAALSKEQLIEIITMLYEGEI